jgi:hypothetical protein
MGRRNHRPFSAIKRCYTTSSSSGRWGLRPVSATRVSSLVITTNDGRLHPPNTESPCGTKSITIHTCLCCHSCDGPANGLVSGQQVAGATHGCVVCDICGRTVLGGVRYGGARRYLPVNHPTRLDPAYGAAELRPPPRQRTIAEARRQGATADVRAAAGEARDAIGLITKVPTPTIDICMPRVIGLR